MAEFFKDTYGAYVGIRFASGREVRAPRGLVAVNPDGKMGKGYGGPLGFTRKDPQYPSGPVTRVPNFTAEEVGELADLEIALWEAVKARGSWEDW